MKKTLIERIEVGSGGAASITFSSISADYTDLYLVLSGRSTDATLFGYVNVSFNGSTTNRSGRQLYGTGSATGSQALTNGNTALISAGTTTSNTFGSVGIYIPNYTSSNAKSASIDGVSENNATASYQTIDAFLWNDTSAITSITLTLGGGNFAQYSSASLYGVSAGNDGTTTVS